MTREENEALVMDARKRVSSLPAAELGILFAYHKVTGMTESNLSSLIENNPNAVIVPISVVKDVHFSSGFWLDRTPFWGDLTGYQKEGCWENLDAVYYEYYRNRSENCKRWLIAEWDLHCNGDVRDFFGPLWDKSFVATEVHEQDKEWFWFKDVEKMPEGLRRHACGVSPLTGSLISDEAMEKLVLGSWWIDRTVFCELRMATILRSCGVEITTNPAAMKNLAWYHRPTIDGKGLWHPVKY